MGLKYGDALRDVTLQQILGVMKEEKGFDWCSAAIKAVEVENNARFDIYASRDLSDKKTKEWFFVETLTANDKFEARRHRKIKRNPQYNYGAIVNFEKDGEPVVRVHYVHDERDKNMALLSMKMRVVEDFLEWKGFKTSDEVSEYIHKKEEESDNLYRFLQASGKLSTKYMM